MYSQDSRSSQVSCFHIIAACEVSAHVFNLPAADSPLPFLDPHLSHFAFSVSELCVPQDIVDDTCIYIGEPFASKILEVA